MDAAGGGELDFLLQAVRAIKLRRIKGKYARIFMLIAMLVPGVKTQYEWNGLFKFKLEKL